MVFKLWQIYKITPTLRHGQLSAIKLINFYSFNALREVNVIFRKTPKLI